MEQLVETMKQKKSSPAGKETNTDLRSLPHLQYAPDLAPYDEVVAQVKAYIETNNRNGIESFENSWNDECIARKGDFVEK